MEIPPLPLGVRYLRYSPLGITLGKWRMSHEIRMHVCHAFLPSLELGFHSRVRIYEFLFIKSRRFGSWGKRVLLL